VLAVRGQRDRAHEMNDEIRISKLEIMTKLKTCNKGEGVSFFAISSNNCHVMLSEAKHLRLLSLGGTPKKNDRRFFASLRMTVSRSFRHSFVIRHSCFVIFLALGITQLFAEKRPITEK